MAGQEIPYLARIVQILDVYDALTHARSYKPALSSAEAIAIILEANARGWHEPILVEQFVEFAKKKASEDHQTITHSRFSSLQLTAV